MNKRKDIQTEQRIAVDINTLMAMLCVGKNSADKIGEDAGAVLRIGRRKLYNVGKIQAYINGLTGEEV